MKDSKGGFSPFLPFENGVLKGPCHRNKFFIYERYHLPEHYTLGENFVKAPFSSKIADQAEIVRVKGSEKQAIVSCNGSKK